MKKATITTVLQGCKGPQGRTRLAVLIGGVAMLLLLLSELMPTGTKSAAASTAPQEIVAENAHGVFLLCSSDIKSGAGPLRLRPCTACGRSLPLNTDLYKTPAKTAVYFFALAGSSLYTI